MVLLLSFIHIHFVIAVSAVSLFIRLIRSLVPLVRLPYMYSLPLLDLVCVVYFRCCFRYRCWCFQWMYVLFDCRLQFTLSKRCGLRRDQSVSYRIVSPSLCFNTLYFTHSPRAHVFRLCRRFSIFDSSSPNFGVYIKQITASSNVHNRFCICQLNSFASIFFVYLNCFLVILECSMKFSSTCNVHMIMMKFIEM